VFRGTLFLQPARQVSEGVWQPRRDEMASTKRAARVYEERRRQQQWLEAEVARLIAGRFASASMSNAKWVKLFRAVEGAGIRCGRCRWKLVVADQIQVSDFPKEWTGQAVCLQWDYDWIVWKHIQWVEVETDDVGRLNEVVNRCGRFDVEINGNALRVHGYRESAAPGAVAGRPRD
jgi:hypothetical protein